MRPLGRTPKTVAASGYGFYVHGSINQVKKTKPKQKTHNYVNCRFFKSSIDFRVTKRPKTDLSEHLSRLLVKKTASSAHLVCQNQTESLTDHAL